MKDVYILDTDPCPQFSFVNTSKNKLLKNIRDFTNREEFSDVTFIVEGKQFFAHKLILSLLRYVFDSFTGLVKNLKQCSLMA